MGAEETIRELFVSGNLHGAATKAIEEYGPEVLGFLANLLCDDGDACEVFSETCEDMWIGLARFQWRCSMRTWLYVLAKHAATRFRLAPHRRRGVHVPLSAAGDLVARVRSETQPHLQTDVKTQFAALREALDPEDRALLVLRLDRSMSWKDVARTFSPDDDSDEMLDRVAARLRKRLQVLKGEIRDRAREVGLLKDRAV